MQKLPIDDVIPELRSALNRHMACVLQAPPGAGKTTRLPLAVLDEPWLAGQRILMLEPRRLAAGAAARQMARTLGEAVGETVGYRIRFDSKVSARTRIEVVTEGILTRRLQHDPELAGVGLVIFDEFHERSLNTDLALALSLEAQAALRPELRLLVMSATLDAAPVARLLGDAPLITSEGRAWPVEARYLGREPEPRTPLAATVHAGVRQALREEAGNVLVFLPGVGEIRAVEERLRADAEPGLLVAPLYGELAGEAQQAALDEAPPGVRKLVLATAIAETSLTIPGIRVVVDGGWSRAPAFDPVSGMTRLTTQRLSLAAADQRRGRAGRVQAGVCYRLWTEGIQAGLKKQTEPEILTADLAPLLLELAAWGAEPNALAWLDAPPAAAVAQARELLQELGALDGQGRITGHGRAMAELAVHPRLAHMCLKGKALGQGDLACLLAGLLGERDIWRGGGFREADVVLRVHALRALEAKRPLPAAADRASAYRALDAAKQHRRRLELRAEPRGDEEAWAGLLLAFAYPDRIAQARPGGRGRYLLSGGRGAVLDEADPLAREDYLCAAELDGQAREAKIFLAARLSRDDIERHFAERIAETERIEWSARDEAVLARREWRLGELVLKTEALKNLSGEVLARGLCAGIRAKGLAVLPWSEAAMNYRQRLGFLHGKQPAEWPDVSDQALVAGLEDWLLPYLTGMSRLSHLAQLDLLAALKSLLPWEAQQRMEALAPETVRMPTGSRIRLDYSPETPVLAVRLQELFGEAQTPRILGSALPVLLHMLSPGHKPVAVTDDLARFWTVGYPDVKKDMKGRYPKHYWPDNPLEAEPTARAKPRGT
ncbi:MAG: ATP-dependent helicase HrpB [Gammaproteobacteria bacterium]|nr:ATP-dependent helicase HrpB [Gammaproteobacteria bacterium]